MYSLFKNIFFLKHYYMEQTFSMKQKLQFANAQDDKKLIHIDIKINSNHTLDNQQVLSEIEKYISKDFTIRNYNKIVKEKK